jgi:hypothetical protein
MQAAAMPETDDKLVYRSDEHDLVWLADLRLVDRLEARLSDVTSEAQRVLGEGAHARVELCAVLVVVHAGVARTADGVLRGARAVAGRARQRGARCIIDSFRPGEGETMGMGLQDDEVPTLRRPP